MAAAAGAGCAAQDEAGDEGPDKSPGEMTALDAATAAQMDRDQKSRAGLFDVPGTCYSVSVLGSRFQHLDMHNKVVTPVAGLPQISGQMLSSLGHFGGALVACQPSPAGSEIAIYDLDGSSAKSVPIDCHAVTGDGDHLWVLDPPFIPPPDRAIREYTSFAALVADQPSRTLPAPSAFSLGVGSDRLIAAWHSTNEVTLVSLADGSHTTSPLQGYDNWIFGSNESFGNRYMVGGWAEDSRGIHVFDPTTGASGGRMFADLWLAGLTCGNP